MLLQHFKLLTAVVQRITATDRVQNRYRGVTLPPRRLHFGLPRCQREKKGFERHIHLGSSRPTGGVRALDLPAPATSRKQAHTRGFPRREPRRRRLAVARARCDAPRLCRRAGVVVRPFPGEGVRVTVGEPEANDIFLKTAELFRKEL